MTIRERIQRNLERRGLSQAKVALLVGVSRAQLGRILAGKRGPAPDVAKRLAAVAGMPSATLALLSERPASRAGET